MHILCDDMKPCPAGTSGTVWFVNACEFEYFNDAERTAEAYSPDSTMSTAGDMDHVDEEGSLLLIMSVCMFSKSLDRGLGQAGLSDK